MIGNKIKKARLEKGLSQQQLAKLISTSKQNISSYERNVTSCPNDILTKLSEVLEMDFNFSQGEINTTIRLTKEENRLVQECIEVYVDSISEIETAPIIKRKLDVLEKTNLNTLTLKELDTLILEVMDDIYIYYDKTENKNLLNDENENLLENIKTKLKYWKNQILESFPNEIKNNFNNISNINIEISNINEKVYEYCYYPPDYEYRINRMSKLEDLNYNYYLGVEQLNCNNINNYLKITYEEELTGRNTNMILYSITNIDDYSKGYVAIEKAPINPDREYELNTSLYDNDNKQYMYSKDNVTRALKVLEISFNSSCNVFDITRKLTEKEVIKILNRTNNESEYYTN